MRFHCRPAVFVVAVLCVIGSALAQPLPAPAVDPNTLPPLPKGTDPAPAANSAPAIPIESETTPATVDPGTTEFPAATITEAAPVTEGGWMPSASWRPVGNATGGDFVNGMQVGSPYYYSANGYPSVGGHGGGFGDTGHGWTGYGGWDPYQYHFGPGYHRHSNYGHYRFPYYSYRRPWYFPGAPSYNRDTNYPW